MGRHARRAQARAGPPDGGLRRVPRAHRPPPRPSGRRPRRARVAGGHPDLLHPRGQRGVGRGPPQRQLQRVPVLQRRGRAGDAGVPALANMDQVGHAAGLQPLLGGLGSRDGHARTSGPSRWPRTGVARATGRSSTGPAGIREGGQVRDQFHHVIDVAPTILEAAGLPHADERQRRAADAAARGGHELLVRCGGRAGPASHAVLRDRGQSRHLPRGLDGGDQARDPVDRHGRAAGLRRRRVGALRPGRLDAGTRPGGADAGEARRAAAALPRGGAPVQRAADRRPASRAVRRRDGGPASAGPPGRRRRCTAE